jgi:hypothetical protein
VNTALAIMLAIQGFLAAILMMVAAAKHPIIGHTVGFLLFGAIITVPFLVASN